MIKLGPNSFLIEYAYELPDFTGATDLFLDIETQNNTSGLVSKKVSGRYPFKGDRIAGIAVTADDVEASYYIPLRHRNGNNLSLEAGRKWLEDHVTSVHQWVNHNVAFDATLCHAEGVEFTCRIVDTLTLSKVHDTDRMSYGLKTLCKEWLGLEMSEEATIKAYLKGIKSDDYSRVPSDILGEYACMDVLANRQLWRYLVEHRPESMSAIWETEILLTAVLYDMEVSGLQVDPTECKLEKLKSLRKSISAGARLAELIGFEFTNSNQCCQQVLLEYLGLPILSTKKEVNDEGRQYDTGRPTFDSDAMSLYRVHPSVTSNPKAVEILSNILEYREETHFQGLFLNPFEELKDENDRIHPTYNQVVRTGRMSCSRPNSQQQNKRSKSLIHPFDGMGFISCDYSQIEFRLIAHYIQDEDMIRAYHDNPDTDFHQWVAEMIHVSRKAGKTLNFGMAYGAGKKKVTSSLVGNPDIIEEIGAQVNELVEKGEIHSSQRTEVFKAMCQMRASEVYQRYHETIPGIRSTSEAAARVARMRGFVFNAYGRRRHFPNPAHSRKAFNTIVQGCAMDIMKERMVALAPRYNSVTRDLGLIMAANVHDEILTQAPWEVCQDPTVHTYIRNLLESPSIEFRVPIRTGLGISNRSWAEACGDEVRMEGTSIVGGPII